MKLKFSTVGLTSYLPKIEKFINRNKKVENRTKSNATERKSYKTEQIDQNRYKIGVTDNNICQCKQK